MFYKAISRLAVLAYFVLLCSRFSLADNCFEKDGATLKYKGCSEVDVTLQTAAESYTMTIGVNGASADSKEKMSFRLGECEVPGTLIKNVKNELGLMLGSEKLILPIEVVISKSSVIFTGKDNVSYSPPSCTVDFTQIDGGFTSTLLINGEAAPKFEFIITDAAVFVPSSPFLPAWAWVLIALGILALVLVGIAVAVYFSWWKKRSARKKAPLETVRVEPKNAILPTAIAPKTKEKEVPPKQSDEKVEPTTTVEHEKPSTVSAEQLKCIEQPAPAEPRIKKRKKKKAVVAKPIVAKQHLKPVVRTPIRYDIIERTAEDVELLNTTRDDASIAKTVEDDFLNRFPSDPPRFPPKILSKYVGEDQDLRKLLSANQATRRVLIYFKGQPEKTYDAVIKALASFGAPRPRDIMADQLAKELVKIEQISCEIYRLLHDEREAKAALLWSFKTTEEILGLSADELREAIKAEPPKYKQRRRINADLDRIKGEIDRRTFHPIESPILVTLDARIACLRAALVEVVKKEAQRDFCTVDDIFTTEDETN